MRTRKDHSAARGRPSRRAAKNRSKYLPLLAAAGLAFAGLLAYLALGGTLSGQGRAAGAPEEAAPDSRPLFSDRQRRKEVSLRLLDQTRHTKGSPDAPVTIIEFSDFQ